MDILYSIDLPSDKQKEMNPQILPVVIAIIERAFFTMKIIKTDLCNKIRDDWMNDSMVVYVEREIFETIKNEAIL